MARQLDWNATQARAREMTVPELHYAMLDCHKAAEAAWQLEKAGNRVDKTQGYYHDEASVYWSEMQRRSA